MRRTRVQKTVFPNGMTLLTEPMPESRSVAIGYWLRSGSRFESRSESGGLHFIEHMLFKGTRTRTAAEIVREIEDRGGDFNAFTGSESTCYHVSLLDRDTPIGIEILNDVFLHSTFSEEEIERERGVILHELAAIEESPDELLFDVFYEKVFPGHGLGRRIGGTPANVRKFKRADLVRLFRKFYRPDQLVISVAGNVSHGQIRRMLQPLSSLPARRGALRPEPAPRMRPGAWWREFEGEQVHVIWAVEGFGQARSQERLASVLLSLHLGGGMSSALFQEIREKRGLAYQVYASIISFQDTGAFYVYLATQPPDVDECLEIVETEVGRLCETKLSASELKALKTNLKGTLILGAEGSESRMSANASAEIYTGAPFSLERVCRDIDGLKAEDLQRAARLMFGRARRSVMALGPSPKARRRHARRSPTQQRSTTQPRFLFQTIKATRAAPPRIR